MSRKCVYEGKETISDELRSGRPLISRNPDWESATNAGTRSATDAEIDCGGNGHWQGHCAHHRPR